MSRLRWRTPPSMLSRGSNESWTSRSAAVAGMSYICPSAPRRETARTLNCDSTATMAAMSLGSTPWRRPTSTMWVLMSRVSTAGGLDAGSSATISTWCSAESATATRETAYAVPTASTSTPSPSACRARDSRAVSVRPSALWPIAPCAGTAATVEQPGCQTRTVEPKLPGLSRLAGGAGQKSTGRWRRPGDVRADTACQPAGGCHVRRRTVAADGPSRTAEALAEDLLEALDGVAHRRGAGQRQCRRARPQAEANLRGLAGEHLHRARLRRELRMARAQPVRSFLQRVARAGRLGRPEARHQRVLGRQHLDDGVGQRLVGAIPHEGDDLARVRRPRDLQVAVDGAADRQARGDDAEDRLRARQRQVRAQPDEQPGLLGRRAAHDVQRIRARGTPA